MFRKIPLVVILTALTVGCGPQTNDERLLSDAIVADGFTCANIARMSTLEAQDLVALRIDLIAKIGGDRLRERIDSRETCQDPSLPGVERQVSTKRQALGGKWTHEYIEQGDYGHGGTSESGIYRDDSTSKICGGEWPYDYILYHQLSGAHNDRDKIRISPQNPSSWCYFSNPSDARVYESDDVLTCVGYWHVFWCPVSAPPQYGDTRIWLDK
jgi:hypothetical protein